MAASSEHYFRAGYAYLGGMEGRNKVMKVDNMKEARVFANKEWEDKTMKMKKIVEAFG